MTQEELEIAQAACCVGTIWDQYEGTEKFNEMVGKRVQHLIKLVRNHLQQEQPEVDLEAEIDKMIRSVFYDLNGIAIAGSSEYADVEAMVYIARHFYELGLNARKEDQQ